MRSHRTIRQLAPLSLMVLPLVAGCASGPRPPPSAGEARGGVPDLAGATVLLLPTQRRAGMSADVDAELAFALESVGSRAEWIGPGRLREHLSEAPSLDVRIEALPVDMFLTGEVLRIGDPLYGDLRRLAVFDGARFALIPVAARYRAAADTVAGGFEIVAVFLDVASGQVLWHGVTQGQGAAEDPAALTRAAEALARWFR